MAIDVETAARRQAREFAQRSLVRLREHLDKLGKAGVRPIVIGGWAVWAHGSPIGSRDIDSLIRQSDQRAAGDALGNSDFMAAHLEGDSMFDYAFLEATNRSNVGFPVKFQYKPVLSRHTVEKNLPVEGKPLPLVVPDATTLLFLKLKAFADRSFAYHVKQESEEFKRLGEDAKEYVDGQPIEYWAAKAAKDMDDIAFLSGLPLENKRLGNLLDNSRLRKFAIREWARKDPALLAIADKIREEHGELPGFVLGRHASVMDLLM